MQDNSFSTKYKYMKKIGQGGCGEVFLAENRNLGNLWAIKEIPKNRDATPGGYIEPEILKRLNHPALPRICDVYEDEHKIYIVEDYIEGISLKQELDSKGKFDEGTVVNWGIQLCGVLEYLHSHKPDPIIYGDMKPHNILLTPEGFIKLVDFGISTFLTGTKPEEINTKDSGFCGQTAFIGTKGYAAPEQFRGRSPDRASDIYSLGITLIQLATGFDPIASPEVYFNENYGEYLSYGLSKILKNCIDPQMEMRYSSVRLLMNELKKHSIHTLDGPEKDLRDYEKTPDFSRIAAFTGARGAGASTLTLAAAQYLARGAAKVCIADMSESQLLEKGLNINHKRKEVTEPYKISSNLFYVNFNSVLGDDLISGRSALHRELVRLQDNFSFILFDTGMKHLKYIQQYLNHIFIVTDMNPYNIQSIGERLKKYELIQDCTARSSFIINKFYKGELSAQHIIRSIFLTGDTGSNMQDFIIGSDLYEVPYEEKVYFRWIYSCFGEPLKFRSLFSDSFGRAISLFVSRKLSKKIKKYPGKSRVQFIKKTGGHFNQWERE